MQASVTTPQPVEPNTASVPRAHSAHGTRKAQWKSDLPLYNLQVCVRDRPAVNSDFEAVENRRYFGCTGPGGGAPYRQKLDSTQISALRFAGAALLGIRAPDELSFVAASAGASNGPLQPAMLSGVRGPPSIESTRYLTDTPIPGSRTLCLKNNQRVYKTGKALGHGAYSTVRTAVHLATGHLYACKVVRKQSADARILARWEISLLRRLAGTHRNIIVLHESFQSRDNYYLIMDLCAGGELHTRVCDSGSYDESRASGLLRTLLGAVDFLHAQDIVHRDLKPENILFRTPEEDAEPIIADFGLSCIVKGTRRLLRVCGTVGYMAPEIFQKVGYGKPVDVWAVGVIAYFLLSGQPPFDRDTEEEEVAAIVSGDFAFQAVGQWGKTSDAGQDFVHALLTVDPAARPTVAQALEQPWLITTVCAPPSQCSTTNN